MKSIKSVINVVREWAYEICEEDDRQLFQMIDGVIADEERIYLHICDENYFVLESIDVRGGDGAHIFLTDNDHDKTCLYTLSECEDFEPIEYCMHGCPGSEFFTPDRLTELRRRIKDLLEIKEVKEKCKANDIKLISDPNKPTALRPDNVDIIDVTAIVHKWAFDICHESGFRILCTCDIDGVDFELIGPSSGITVVIEKLGNGFDIVLSDNIPGSVAHVIYDATGEVDTAVSGSSWMITHEQLNVSDGINNSTPVKNSYSFSPNILELGLDKITPLTLTHDIIKHGHAMRRWCFDSSWISPNYDVVDANKQYRRRIDYLIDKFRRLSAEYGRAESALSKIPNVPLDEYCTHKFPIQRKLILPTVETIDGKTVMYFKVDDLSERVIKKYHGKPSILLNTVDKALNSKNSMFNIFDQGTCTRPSDEVLCYIIENMASRNPYGIKAVPDKILDYCSLEKILVLLNLSSAELKGITEDERENMVEYLNRHDSLTQYGGGTTVNGILISLMCHIDATDRTLEHNVVVIDNSSTLQAAVKITQLVNMLINCDITLGWMKNHKGECEINDPDPTLVDKVKACLRK